MAEDTARRRTRVAISAVYDAFIGITEELREEDMAERNRDRKSVPSSCSGEKSRCKALTEKGIDCWRGGSFVRSTCGHKGAVKRREN